MILLRSLRVAVAVVLCAVIASVAEVSAQSAPIRVRVPGNTRLMLIGDPVAIPASAALTFQAATAVLQELKVPLAVNEPQSGVLGSGGFPLRRVLGSVLLSKYLNCGSGINGDYAEVRRVTMALFVWVETVGAAESRVKVGMLAGAEDMAGVTRNAVLCGSTGALETMIAEEVRKRAVMP